jgi:hypothetical protein
VLLEDCGCYAKTVEHEVGVDEAHSEVAVCGCVAVFNNFSECGRLAFFNLACIFIELAERYCNCLPSGCLERNGLAVLYPGAVEGCLLAVGIIVGVNGYNFYACF